MCGRYTLAAEEKQIERRFGAKFIMSWRPNYNAAPSQLLPIITNEAPDRIVLARWGFVPEWAGETWNLKPQINARVETVASRRAFRDAWHGRHCLVLADGFYEWRRSRDYKQPFRFVDSTGDLFAMAGIWARSTNGFAPPTFAILTTTANPTVAPVHERMPIVLPRGSEQSWLPPALGAAIVFPSTPADRLSTYPVSKAINHFAFNEPRAIELQLPDIN